MAKLIYKYNRIVCRDIDHSLHRQLARSSTVYCAWVWECACYFCFWCDSHHKQFSKQKQKFAHNFAFYMNELL